MIDFAKYGTRLASGVKYFFVLSFFGIVVGISPVLAEVREDFFGKAEGYPIAPGYPFNHQPKFRVGAYSGRAIDTYYKDRDIFLNSDKTGRTIRSIKGSFPIGRKPDYIVEKHPILAMALIKDGAIIYENYRYGTNADSRFNSESMAKTITALVVGRAVEDGHIKSLDEKIGNIVKELQGSPVGESTIRQALTMTCGVEFKFSGDSAFDYLKVKFARRGDNPFSNIFDYYRTLPRTEPGKAFSYDPHCTDALGMVINRVTNKRFLKYFEDRIWSKLGATGRGSWLNMNPNPEFTSAANLFNATLHDYAKIALLMLQEGRVDGQQVISANWIKEMTTGIVPTGGHPSRFVRYGYQTWVRKDGPGSWYAFLGFNGQKIYIDQKSGSAMIIFALEESHVPDSDTYWEWFISKSISDFRN